MRDSRESADTYQFAAAKRWARTFMVGFDIAEEEGCPLTPEQKIELLTCAFHCFDGMRQDLVTVLSAEHFAHQFLMPMMAPADGFGDGEAA